MQGRKGAKHLTKEEELELGVIIQDHFKAKEELEQAEDLSPEEEVALKQRISRGEAAVDKLVRANIGLVMDRAKIFKTRYPAAPEFEDLVQEGMTGLMTAIAKYDPARNNKFSTVAYHWIAQAVARGANKTGRLVRLPENRINDFTRITSITNSPEAEGLTQAELDELIMDELGLSRTDLLNIRDAAATHASLNKVVSSDSGSAKEFIDFVAEKHTQVSSEEQALRTETEELLLSSIEFLTPIQQDVILSNFAIGGMDSLSQSEVCEKWGILPAKYKRVKDEAMKGLREIVKQRGLTFQDFTISD